MKRMLILGAACAFASGALFAQEFAIPGKDFESGAADAKLAEIARQAAASGKSIIVTTPPYWQARAASKIRAAAPGVQVKTSDAFFENVLIRVVDGDRAPKAEVAAKPAESPAKIAEAPAAAKPVETVAAKPVRVETRVADTPVAPAAAQAEVPRAPAPVASAEVVQPRVTPKAAEAPVVVAPATEAPAPPAAVPAVEMASIAPSQRHPAADEKLHAKHNEIATIQRAFENQLNLGMSASGTLRPMQLHRGDEIFVHGPVRAVVRRERARAQLFWIDGDLQLDRAEIVKTGADRYRVDEALRNVANPSVRAMHTEPRIFAAKIPAGKIRGDMEKHFNDAKTITAAMHAEDLRYGDLFYLYRNHGVIFRRNDPNFDRYWLDGNIDLNQAGVVKDGDAYRIVSEKL